jgi:hypothetical protein
MNMKLISLSLPLIILSCLSSVVFAKDGNWHNIRVLARIHVAPGKIEVESEGRPLAFPLKLKDKKLEKSIKSLKPDDEVILTGHMINEATSTDDALKMNPIFVIESITPISLHRIGRMEDFTVEEKPLTFRLETPYEPKSLSVSQGVVSAITITATVLLLKSLVAKPTDSSLNDSVNTGLIFSAGALATGMQVLEDVNKKSPSQKP